MRWLIGAGYRHRYFRLDPDVLHVTQLSLRCLADAPHRLYFFLGAVNLLTASIWWFLATILREIQPGLLATSVGLSTQLHPLVMIYGFFPFYIFADKQRRVKCKKRQGHAYTRPKVFSSRWWWHPQPARPGGERKAENIKRKKSINRDFPLAVHHSSETLFSGLQ